MPLHDVTNDRESDAETVLHTGREIAALPEPFEDVRKEIAADAHAGVLYSNVGPSRAVLQPHLDGSTLWRELDGIRKKVPDDLLDSIAIAPHETRRWSEMRLQLNAQRFRRGTNNFDRVLNDG